MRQLLHIFLFLLPFSGVAQQFHFKKYSLEEGLSRSGVFCIVQDKAGFLWVGTEGGGVCVFDGKTFLNYNRQNGLASDDVRVIFQDDRGVLWFGTSNGISYFNGNKFFSLTTDDGLADNSVRSVTQDAEGNIWVGTDMGISIIDPDEKGISGKLQFNFNLPHMKVRSLHAQEDMVWIGTDRGLCKFKDDKITVFNWENGLSNDLILCLYEDFEGALWVGTDDGLNRIYEDEITSWTLMDGLIHSRVRSITQDMYGQIWIGTTEGISIYDGHQFKVLAEQNGLSNERVRCITHDCFDNIWIGTFFGGIMKYNHQDFVSYTLSEGLVSNQILSINEDLEGNILVGTYDGISKLKLVNENLEATETMDLQNGYYNNAVHAIHKSIDGHYWFGTDIGVTVIGPEGVFQLDETNGLENTQVSMIKYYNNKYWIGTKNGLAIAEKKDTYANLEVTFLHPEDGLAGHDVSCITQGLKGEVWVSFADGKVSVFHKDKIVNPSMPFSQNEILSMAVDSTGRIWFGTNGIGIYYGYYNAKKHELDLDHITVNDGLISNSVYSMQVLKKQIWAGHENGLDLIIFESDSAFDIKTYGSEEGFFGMQNNQNASFKDSRGNLWFGTVNGLFCLKYREIGQITSGVPSINYISSVKIGGHKIDWVTSEWCNGVEGQFDLPANLELPYNRNNISFDFIALNFIHPKKIRYTWKLEGFDEDWCAPSNKNYASYTNLEPGQYTFLLRSSDEHGTIVGDPIEFDFSIKKPFWQTWGFRIVAVILGAFLIWLIMRIRTRQLIRQRKALEEIIQDRTKEIQSQADELKLKNQEVTDSIQYSKRIQGSILPGKEKLKQVLGDHFIFFKPKDIVSGDFYWAEEGAVNKKIKYFAAADCTGHGVPGAMVSLICTRALNTSVREATLKNTNDILDTTRRIVVDAFTDHESGQMIKDGMDISLCMLDYSDEKNIRFQFSGAQNPIWIVRSENDEDIAINGSFVSPDLMGSGFKLFEIKGDKQPVGYFDGAVPFSLSEGVLKKGDRIYLFTDGFADQFGGDKGKKFKYKTLKALILSSQKTSISSQQDIFHEAFFAWKNDLEQVDDVCLIGVQV